MPPRRITETKTDFRLEYLRNEFEGDCWQSEFTFHESRKWRFDYASPIHKIAIEIEIEGGVFGRGKPCLVCHQKRGGAHSSIAGILRDVEKYNAETAAGWKVLRFTPSQFEQFESVVALVDSCRI